MIIYDLDGTVIDSSHRQLTKPDGSLDLEHWRENCTKDKIMQDRLLPLAEHMRRNLERGAIVAVSTARVLSRHDLAFLNSHGLRPYWIFSRAPNDTRRDHDLKAEHFATMREYGFDPMVMFDDNLNVLEMAASQGIATHNATELNAAIA